MDERDSKEYSWVSLLAAGRICDQPCELLHVYVRPTAANSELIVYNGNDASGQVVVDMFSTTFDGYSFTPPEPVYCDKGLAVVFTAQVTRVFVQFRLIPHE